MIVIGASAGGVEALTRLFSCLPPDLNATICVVLHLNSFCDSHLPEILNSAGSLYASHPDTEEVIRKRRVYVAPPNRHLVVKDSKVRLATDPRENRHRPAIDPLFRSAALAYGPRVIGVILTGTLDDGAAGLWEIKRRGGIAVVQSPEDALFPGMPQNAISNVKVDYVVPLGEMGELLTNLCRCEARK